MAQLKEPGLPVTDVDFDIDDPVMNGTPEEDSSLDPMEQDDSDCNNPDNLLDDNTSLEAMDQCNSYGDMAESDDPDNYSAEDLAMPVDLSINIEMCRSRPIQPYLWQGAKLQEISQMIAHSAIAVNATL